MTELEEGALRGRVVMLFDGTCGLCNRAVRFFMARMEEMLFVPLESELGRELLARYGALPEGLALIVNALTEKEGLYVRAEATIRGLEECGAAWSGVARLLSWVPAGLRDFGYGVVARWRYRVFGKYEACPLPSVEERARVLGV